MNPLTHLRISALAGTWLFLFSSLGLGHAFDCMPEGAAEHPIECCCPAPSGHHIQPVASGGPVVAVPNPAGIFAASAWPDLTAPVPADPYLLPFALPPPSARV